MATDWDLEDWLLAAGERVERRRTAIPSLQLSAPETLLREVWLFDMETRNGGVSQYFCNRGLAQWQMLRNAWSNCDIQSLAPIIAEVERVIFGVADPYLATLEASPAVEQFYETHQPQVLRELRKLIDGPATGDRSPTG